MTRYNHTKEKPTDPRPAYIHLGIDTDSGSHFYHIPSESVYTIEGAAVSYHESLDGHPISTYLEYVADHHGWLLRFLDHQAADTFQTWTEHTGTGYRNRLEHTTRIPFGKGR